MRMRAKTACMSCRSKRSAREGGGLGRCLPFWVQAAAHFPVPDGCWEVAWDPDLQYDEDGLLVS